jgi:omega-amidase
MKFKSSHNMKNLNLALIQHDIMWEEAAINLKRVEEKFRSLQEPCDLVILPEMFTTGFTMNVEKCAEPVDGESVNWMKTQASKLECVIAGSQLVREKGKYFNRFYWVQPDGHLESYDKRHLFTMAREHQVMTPGQSQKIVEINGWKVNLQICYDLRFPVWSRNAYSNNTYAYDLIVYVANWPEVRSAAYKALLPARAIENQCYVVWVNRVGKDGNGIYHTGDSMVVGPTGEVVAMCKTGEEEVLKVVLSAQSLHAFRERFSFAPDWDRFTFEK